MGIIAASIQVDYNDWFFAYKNCNTGILVVKMLIANMSTTNGLLANMLVENMPIVNMLAINVLMATKWDKN